MNFKAEPGKMVYTPVRLITFPKSGIISTENAVEIESMKGAKDVEVMKGRPPKVTEPAPTEPELNL